MLSEEIQWLRMWMNDTSAGVQDGWGPPNTDNPYFNTTAQHSYSVGEDFNHTSTYTREYVNRTIKHWINEFKIDGFPLGFNQRIYTKLYRWK